MTFETPELSASGGGDEFIVNIRHKIDKHLKTIYPETSQSSRLVCALRHALLSPGKRIRPTITLLSHADCGGDMDNVLHAACAVEMVHAASLVMDDLPSMDNARLRRGCLATHVVFGEGTGMLSAVALLNEAYCVIANGTAGDPAQKLEAIKLLANSVGPEGLAGGQECDIMCTGADGIVNSLSDIEKRHYKKTGALFASAASIGAVLAGADKDRVKKMHSFGSALGLAYQALDDVIDAEATEVSAGKDVAQDEGKATVVSFLGQDGARHMARRWLQRAMLEAERTKSEEPSGLALLARVLEKKFGLVELKSSQGLQPAQD